MISRQLYALLLVTSLATVASQLYLPTSQTDASVELGLEETRPTLEHSGTSSASLRQGVEGGKDLFASRIPPPPPQPKVVIAPSPPPEPPRAPPVPFQYLGLMEDDGVVHIYLKQGENPLLTHVGEVLDDVYLIRRLDRQGVHVTYLPLKQEQLIPIGH